MGWEHERIADDIRQIAGVDGPPSALARALGIDVAYVTGMVDRGGLAQHGARWFIGVRRSLPEAYREHTIGHELAHWWARTNGVIDSEEQADYVGAALQMPRALFFEHVRAIGYDLSGLATAFEATETAVALRLGELEREPLAVVAPANVRVRGPDEWTWPDVATVRQWARNGRPGLSKTRLRDDRRRVLLQPSETFLIAN
jgi:hypothetical protein